MIGLDAVGRASHLAFGLGLWGIASLVIGFEGISGCSSGLVLVFYGRGPLGLFME